MQDKAEKKLQIDVWSDIACPWCWVGKRRLEGALEGFAHRDDVELVWHSFELDAKAPPAPAEPSDHAAMLAKKYGMSREQADAAISRLTTVAKADGLDMRFDRIRSGNTFDAHRLVHFAATRDKQDAMKERLFRAYFTGGEAMSDHAALTRLAVEIGLDAEEVAAALASNAHADDVREDERTAREIGVRGVPFFVVASKYAVSGAQPSEALAQVLDRAWSEVEAAAAPDASALACGPDGCA